jgi:hypothetical protein
MGAIPQRTSQLGRLLGLAGLSSITAPVTMLSPSQSHLSLYLPLPQILSLQCWKMTQPGPPCLLCIPLFCPFTSSWPIRVLGLPLFPSAFTMAALWGQLCPPVLSCLLRCQLQLIPRFGTWPHWATHNPVFTAGGRLRQVRVGGGEITCIPAICVCSAACVSCLSVSPVSCPYHAWSTASSWPLSAFGGHYLLESVPSHSPTLGIIIPPPSLPGGWEAPPQVQVLRDPSPARALAGWWVGLGQLAASQVTLCGFWRHGLQHPTSS